MYQPIPHTKINRLEIYLARFDFGNVKRWHFDKEHNLIEETLPQKGIFANTKFKGDGYELCQYEDGRETFVCRCAYIPKEGIVYESLSIALEESKQIGATI